MRRLLLLVLGAAALIVALAAPGQARRDLIDAALIAQGPPLATFSAALPMVVATTPTKVTYSCPPPCLTNPLPFLAMGVYPPFGTPSPATGLIYFGDPTNPSATPGEFFMSFTGSTGGFWPQPTWQMGFQYDSISACGATDLELTNAGNFDIMGGCTNYSTPPFYTVTMGVKSSPGPNPNLFKSNLASGMTNEGNVAAATCTLAGAGSIVSCFALNSTLAAPPPEIEGPGTSICTGVMDIQRTGSSPPLNAYAVQWSASQMGFYVYALLAEVGQTPVVDYWCPR